MSSCLGLYIEDNIIKYAKVSKEKDDIRVESFGVKFYDKLGDAINQVVSETYSAKTHWYLLPTFYLREICAIIYQCIL